MTDRWDEAVERARAEKLSIAAAEEQSRLDAEAVGAAEERAAATSDVRVQEAIDSFVRKMASQGNPGLRMHEVGTYKEGRLGWRFKTRQRIDLWTFAIHSKGVDSEGWPESRVNHYFVDRDGRFYLGREAMPGAFHGSPMGDLRTAEMQLRDRRRTVRALKGSPPRLRSLIETDTFEGVPFALEHLYAELMS